MEHTGDEQPLSNDPEQLHSLEHIAVPASLLPSVLSRLGLADKSSSSIVEVDEQLAALSHQDIAIRVIAVRSLEERRDARTIEPLVAALHDSAWEVRAAAVWALGKFGEQAPVEALMGALTDEDSSVRAAALRTLGQLRYRVSVGPLVQALDDPAWQVREIAVLTLGEYGEQAPRDLLVARLNDEQTSVRQAARMALEQSHPEVLSTIASIPTVPVPEPGADTTFSEQGPIAPGTEGEVEVRTNASSNGHLTQFTTYMKMFLSRAVSGSIVPTIDAQSPFFDDEMSNISSGKLGARNARRQPVRSKARRLRPIAEGVLVALLILGLAISWLVIQHRLRPSQGSLTTPLLAYYGYADGPAVWSLDSKYISFVADPTPVGETVLVWNRATGQVTNHMLHILLAQAEEHQAVFAPDGKHLAFVERDSSNKVAVQVWDVVAWRSIFRTYYSSPSGYLNVYWSPDSTRIVIPNEDGTIQVWNVGSEHELVTCHVPPVDGMPASIYMSPDGHNIIFGYGIQNTYVLDLTTCKLLTLPSSDSSLTYWSPQGNRFATISFTDASRVQVWDAHTGRNLASFHLTASVSELVWTPDGTRIVTWGDTEVDVLDVATRRIGLKVMPTKIDLLPVWALSPDGERLASLSGADTVQIWDAVTGHKLNVYQSPGNSVKVMAWSPDSRTIATGSKDGTVRVWYADRSPQTYHSDSSAVLNIAWSPDGEFITAGNLDGSIWVWKVN